MDNTTMLWTVAFVVAAVAVGWLGWLLRGLVDRPRHAADRAVAEERAARLEAELNAARTAAEARAQAPEQVAEAMAPVQTAIGRLEEAVARAEGGRVMSTTQLADQLRAVAEATSISTDGLRRETARLVGALGHSEVRGRWGEFQLRRLLESSGLVRDVHFTEQQSVHTDAGILRPDVVLHLGEDKAVVVDAKVSLRAILGLEAGDPQDEVAAARVAHAREVRSHVDRLASKEYARQFDTAPEFVVMFLPAESLLAEALACDPGLLEYAFDRNVVLATPTTLMALTRTVGHIWRQDALAANAREVQALGREMAERLSTMLGHLDKLGSALGSGVTAYNRAIASMESRVLVTGRRFTELQGLAVPLESPRQVDLQPRSLAPRTMVDADPEAASTPATSSMLDAIPALPVTSATLPALPAGPPLAATLDTLERQALDTPPATPDTTSTAVA
ncbi:MAG TPA: DNA recombination protein RmuC [Motilibacterales bacterium]|nr:DNA recombination protein RmuC [Motilibacterales bacterium]